MKLDKIDMKILYELDRDCRQAQKQIAKKVGISRNAVLNRIKNLEADGIVRGYYTLVDFSKLGYTLIRVYLKFQNINPKIEKRIADTLLKENTWTVYKTTASWDMAIGFLVKSLSNFNKMWINFLIKYKNYIKEKNVSVFYELIRYTRDYLAEEKQRVYSFYVSGGSTVERVSDSDMQLLRLIAESGKMSLLDISRKLGVSPTAAKAKMRSLEKKKIILAYKAMIDLKKIGYDYYKIDVELNDISIREKIQKYLRFHPNVVFEDIAVGGSDLEFDIEVKNSEEFEKFMNDLKEKFPRAIKFFSFYKAREILKYLYMPPN